MAEKVNFECVNCGNKVEHDTTESKIPECCGKPMQVEGIDACDSSTTASYAGVDNITFSLHDIYTKHQRFQVFQQRIRNHIPNRDFFTGEKT